MSSKSNSKGPSPLAIFFLISALVTPPIMWLILLLHAKPEDWGHIIRETLKRPLTYLWFGYASVVIWFVCKAYSD